MSTQQRIQTAYGLSEALPIIFPEPIIAQRAPTTNDKAQFGTIWVDQPNDDAYVLTSIVANSASWINIGGGGGTFTTVTASGNITSTAGNIAATAGTVTGGTGLVATTGGVTATAGNVTTTNGSVAVGNTAASAAASEVDFKKSRSGGVITTGDALGAIAFQGHDGTGYITGSKITSTSSGTIATNRVASDLQFYTHPDSTSASTLRLTISPVGTATIAAPDSGYGLVITGGGMNVVAGDINTVTGNINAGANITGLMLQAAGDSGSGTVSTTTITNAVNTSLSSGTLSIKSTTASNGDNAGFLKIYVGATVAYVPYFTNIAP